MAGTFAVAFVMTDRYRGHGLPMDLGGTCTKGTSSNTSRTPRVGYAHSFEFRLIVDRCGDCVYLQLLIEDLSPAAAFTNTQFVMCYPAIAIVHVWTMIYTRQLNLVTSSGDLYLCGL